MSGLIGVLVVILATIVLFLWGASRPDTWEVHRTQLRGAALILAALAGLVGYSIVGHLRAPAALAVFVPPYPGAVLSSAPPQVDTGRLWIYAADDDLSQIADFYSEAASHAGWRHEIDTRGGVLHVAIEHDGSRITVMGLARGSGSELVYRVEPAAKAPE